MNIIGNALTELYRVFNIVNKDLFESKLPEPVITIQKGRKKSLGHFTLDKIWVSKDSEENELDDNVSKYEININPLYFKERSAVEIIETLLHEMCHYMNKILDIKDCNGNNHNKKFKEMAESVGLICEKCNGVGYGFTRLSSDLEKYIKNEIMPDESVFTYFRTEIAKERKPREKKTFKYHCPNCGLEIKAKKGVKVVCTDCKKPFEMEVVDEV